MGGVDVPVDVHLERGVHGDDAEAQHDSRVVGYLLGAEHDAGGEEIHVGVNPLERIGGESQGGGAGSRQFSPFHQIHQGLLEHFRVHGERRDFRVFAKNGHHRIADVTDSGLERQEFPGDAFGAHLFEHEVQHVLGYFVTAPVSGREGLNAVGFVALDDADDPSGIHHGVGHTDLRKGIVKGYGNPVRRGRKDDDVRHFPEPF